jgi:ATP-binding cassette subfamily B protein
MSEARDKPEQRADPADWATVRRFLPYLWPAGRRDLRGRIVGSALFVVLAKLVVLTLPLAYGRAIDAMATHGNGALWTALALVTAYAAGRFVTVVFDNVRNIIFERVGQEAVRQLTEDVFRRLHELSLRFHLSRRTGEVTKIVERGSKSINTMIYFLLFNIAPTAVEMVVVATIFQLKFGWQMVAATAVTVVSYIWLTRVITEWRTNLRHNQRVGESLMTDVNGEALSGITRLSGALKIGRAAINNFPVTFADSPTFHVLGLTDQPAIILGMSELKLFNRVAIDFEQRRILFDLPPLGISQPDPTTRVY